MIKCIIFAIFLCWTCWGITVPQFVPQGYYLKLKPDLRCGILSGLVAINIATYAKPTNTVVLDIDQDVNVNYRSIRVISLPRGHADNSSDADIKVLIPINVERTYFESSHMRIYLKEDLKRDVTYQIQIDFERKINNRSDETSIYSRSYVEDDTKIERQFVIMDLTKKGCSAVFPCFNQSEYKTWFSLSVIRPLSFYALSTAAVNHTTQISGDGSVFEDHFMNTPPMSSNALSLVVSNYPKVIHLKAGDKREVNRFPENRSDVEIIYNRQFLKYIFEECEDRIFNYPLPTLNVITVPNEVNISTINSFGLIVVSDNFLKKEKVYETVNCRIANVIGTISYQFLEEEKMYKTSDCQLANIIRMISYQFFHFLATPISKNSIARTLHLHFVYSIMRQFTSKVGSDTDMEEFFDIPNFRWSYQNQKSYLDAKNFLMVNMLQTVFGLNTLLNGYRNLLYKKQFKTYSDEDIWIAITVAGYQTSVGDETGLNNVKEIAYSWMKIRPIPLINVNVDPEMSEMIICQEPFVFERHSLEFKKFAFIASKIRHKWWIPIQIMKSGNITEPKHITWINQQCSKLYISTNVSDYIIVNPFIIGPYVVNYDTNNWKMLVENFSNLPKSVMIHLLKSAKVLAYTGRLDYDILLNLTEQIKPIKENIQIWDYYRTEIHNDIIKALYDYDMLKYMRVLLSRLSAVYSDIGNDSKSIQRSIWYEDMYCETLDIHCQLNTTYDKLLSEAKNPSGNITWDPYYFLTMKHVSLKQWQAVNDAMFKSLNISQERRQWIISISCSSRYAVAIETMLHRVLLGHTPEKFNFSDFEKIYTIMEVSKRHSRSEIFLEFLDNNFKELKQKSSVNVWNKYLKAVPANFRTIRQLFQVEHFYNRTQFQFGDGEGAIYNAVQDARIQVIWYTNSFSNIYTWLNRYTQGYDRLWRIFKYFFKDKHRLSYP